MKISDMIKDTRKVFDVKAVREQLETALKKSIPEGADREKLEKTFALYTRVLPEERLKEGVKIYVGPISREEALYSYNNHGFYADRNVILSLVKAQEGGLSPKKWCLKVKYLRKEDMFRKFRAFSSKVLQIDGEVTDESLETLMGYLEAGNQKLIIVPLIWDKFCRRAKNSSSEGIELTSGVFAMYDEGRLWVSSQAWRREIPTKAGKKFLSQDGRTVRSVLVYRGCDTLDFD